MSRFSIFLLLTIALSSVAPAFQPADPFKPGKLPPAEVAALQPGLTLRFYAKATDKDALDARRVRLAALHVPADQAPTPFLPPGPFHAKLTGYIKNSLKGMYSFRLTGTGAIVLRINGKVVLDHPDAATAKDKEVEVELAKNYNRIEITYASPLTGDSTVRLYWANEKFGFEPVPPDVIFSRGDDADLVARAALRAGRQLYANLHCAGCHELPGTTRFTECKMPDLERKAPLLDDAGNRFHYDWLVAWIMNPRALRPEATMPNVLSGPDAEKKAADIASYLSALTKERVDLVGTEPSLNQGAFLFKKYGCNSCHRLSDPKEDDPLGRLSLHYVAAKHTKDELARFIGQPHKRYAWTRMPDFRLSPAEMVHLEKYLLANANGKIDAKPKGNARRGEKLFREVGCVNCHQVQTQKSETALLAAKIQSLDKGCLAAKDHGQAPNFALTDEQRAALAAFLKIDGSSLTRETPAEFSQRQVQQLQCASCHRRDGAITRWHAVLEDEGKTPESLPSLTWTGEKLKPAWTTKLLLGQTDHSARPWIKARMPAFSARAEMLAVGLSHEHGFGANEDDRPKPDAKLAAIGEKLIPQQGGFNCINCHGIGKQAAIAPFEAPGINLVDAAVRLRHEYYQRWMLTPDRVDVTMRMPVFSMDGKTTQLREVFDGDARRQFEALWHYIQTLPKKTP